MNGNERYILEGIIIVLAAAYIFYENVLMSFILSPYVYIHYRQRIKERIVHDKKNFKKKFKIVGIIKINTAIIILLNKVLVAFFTSSACSLAIANTKSLTLIAKSIIGTKNFRKEYISCKYSRVSSNGNP